MPHPPSEIDEMMKHNPVLKLIATRRSIRKYKDIPVEWTKMVDILEAGRCAPSCGNLQNWKFIVVTEPEAKHKVAEACVKQYWMEQAPVLIVICSNPDKAEKHYGVRGEKLYSVQNGAAAAMNMILAASSSVSG